jgi:DNA-binding NtrC family response regulator
MKKILIIEDEEGVTMNVGNALVGRYEVLPIVRTAEDAIRLGSRNKPDLIVSSRRSADNNRALDIVFRLRQLHEGNIPVLIIADEADILLHAAEYHYRVLLQPFTYDDLIFAIEATLRSALH